MSDLAKRTMSTIIPGLRYKDGNKAVEWLCEAFGFERHLVVPNEDGSNVVHAQLTFGNGMVMLGGGAHGGEYDAHVQAPTSSHAVHTQAPYIIVTDVDAHHARAVMAGADIFMAPYDPEYGGRAYGCRDFEGHVWNFGSYNPWAEPNP